MNISLSLFIKQIWKLAYLCIICIQMLKHKLQMTFHFMWFLSCHSSLSVKQFHTGKFILKLDQNVHILIFFEIFSAKKSRMNSLYWNVNRKRCSGFSFCLLSKTIFNLKFFMRLVARFMDRTQGLQYCEHKITTWMTQIASTLHLCFSKADFRKFIKIDNTKINNNGTYFRTMLTYWFEFQMLFDFVRNCTDAPTM